MSPVEVITLVERRRRWTAHQKRATVEEAEQPGNSISSLARKYGIHPNQLFKWRRLIVSHRAYLSVMQMGIFFLYLFNSGLFIGGKLIEFLFRWFCLAQHTQGIIVGGPLHAHVP